MKKIKVSPAFKKGVEVLKEGPNGFDPLKGIKIWHDGKLVDLSSVLDL